MEYTVKTTKTLLTLYMPDNVLDALDRAVTQAERTLLPLLHFEGMGKNGKYTANELREMLKQHLDIHFSTEMHYLTGEEPDISPDPKLKRMRREWRKLNP